MIRPRTTIAAAGALVVLAAVLFWRALPEPLFDAPRSTVVTDRDGRLLSARIADDGQWRFPLRRKVPERFATALIAFEDKRFRHHAGVDPIAVARAMCENRRAGRVVSGASTLSMQVIRLALGNPPRTWPQKLYETLLAVRLEMSFDKDEILALYAAHAPFGGNVVGLEAAAWRYFGRPPRHLSWGEAATLAVLPNAPGLIHPGRGREALRERRDQLLRRLHAEGHLEALQLELALREPVPDAPRPLPRAADHLTDTLRAERPGHRFRTTLDRDLQSRVVEVVDRHATTLKRAGVYNAAVVVLDNRTFEVKAYVANTGRPGMDGHGYAMDLVRRPRSTGSLLKPFLYAAMIEHGELQPGSLVPDVPAHFNGFRPENFDRKYRGAVRAREALAHSLNVPHALMLQRHGIGRFQEELEQLGMSTLFRAPDRYGLTLILGGSEGTLWELTSMYANLARAANEGLPRQRQSRRQPVVTAGDTPPREKGLPFGAGAAWLTLQTLVDVPRPGDKQYWQEFASSRRIAWKTGTSYGLRDGWAVGTTPTHTVGVWTGNATGEGRAGLTGTTMAAPILFDVYGQLDTGGWFERPSYRLKEIAVCRSDGYLPTNGCETETAAIPRGAHFDRVSRHHRWVHLDDTGRWRVNADCASVADMRHESRFTLPPVQEHYYRRHNADYQSLPPMRPDCRDAPTGDRPPVSIVYPQGDTGIYIPTDFGGRRSRVVLEAVHRDEDALLYWHIDGRSIGTTRTFHEKAVDLAPGRHRLTVVDETGRRVSRVFRVIGDEPDATQTRAD